VHVHFSGEPDDGQSVSSHHAGLLADDGVAVSFDHEDQDPKAVCRKADAVHLVTFGQRDGNLLRWLLTVRKAGLPIVRYWTGPDYLWARFHLPSRRFAHAVGQLGARQIAPCESLARDLSCVAVTAEPGLVASIHVSSRVEPRPLPENFTVLCHLPSLRRAFYGGEIVDRLIRRLPQVRFLILGDGGTDYTALKNVESLGRVEDVARSIQRATVTIHPLAYGCASRLVLESLSHGRHAITSFDWPHCVKAQTAEAFERAIRTLQENQRFNLAGRKYVCGIYDRDLAQKALRQVFERALCAQAAGAKLRGRWQAAAVAMRYPSVYSRRPFPLPNLDALPVGAGPFRMLLGESNLPQVTART
jgi:hypothetical protein